MGYGQERTKTKRSSQSHKASSVFLSDELKESFTQPFLFCRDSFMWFQVWLLPETSVFHGSDYTECCMRPLDRKQHAAHNSQAAQITAFLITQFPRVISQ